VGAAPADETSGHVTLPLSDTPVNKAGSSRTLRGFGPFGVRAGWCGFGPLARFGRAPDGPDGFAGLRFGIVCAVTELVEHVDERDRVLGIVSRDDAIRRGLLHRVATTVCRDEKGNFLVCRRADGLSRFPAHYEVSFGGAVRVAESYRAAAAREVAEELGVHVTVREVVTFLCHGTVGSYWLGVHEAVVTGEVAPDTRAVSWVTWMTESELAWAARQHRFVPDGQEALRRYQAAVGQSSSPAPR
jgi:isopentenyldiphosphate isomerase